MAKKNPYSTYNRHLPHEEAMVCLTLMVMLMFFSILVSAEHPKSWFEKEFTVAFVQNIDSHKEAPEIVDTRGDFYSLQGINSRTVLSKIQPGDHYRVICGNVPHNHIKSMEKGGYVFVDYEDSVEEYHDRMFGALFGMLFCLIIIIYHLYLISQRGKEKNPSKKKPKEKKSYAPRLPLR